MTTNTATENQTPNNFGWSKPQNNKKQSEYVPLVAKDEWASWKPGANPIRVLSEPHTYYVHTLPELSSDPTKPQKIKCSDPVGYLKYKDKEIRLPLSEVKCPICRKAEPLLPKKGDSSISKEENKKLWGAAFKKIRESGYEPKARWYIAAIMRNANNMIKVCDIGSPIFDGIEVLTKNKKWGNPLEYDVVVNVNKNAPSPANYYMVTSDPKEPLTSDELRMKDEFDFSKLEKLCTPPTEEQISKRIEWLLAQRDKALTPREKTTAVTAEPTNHDGSSDHEMQFPEE